jgi:hypothetical protein
MSARCYRVEIDDQNRKIAAESGRYSTARIATTIAITTPHDSAERPTITTTACPLGKRTSVSVGSPSLAACGQHD